MKEYHFKVTCKNQTLSGVTIGAKAETELKARNKIKKLLKTATKDPGLESLELMCVGRMTPAKLAAAQLGAAGGKKSRRAISPEDQKKMQEARKQKSQQNA